MAATSPELPAGEMIPGTRYRVLRTLGAGGMGVVYQVVKPPNIQGVLKLMSSELTQHEELLVRFFDEVRILAQLDHPNIVKVFDYDALPDGTPFYVMELLNGRTVRDVITTVGRVPPRVAYEITRQLLEALQCAHTNEVPVIHRDIKPENIFLHAPRHGEPVVKLIDFGVSALADRLHDGSFVGTWGYAAPEQIRGERPTPATDLYAVGLVLYEMLAGRGPFDHHRDWKDVSKAQLGETPASVSTFAPWVPPSIVALITSALAKDPRARPRDAYAFAERLFELEWASDGQNPRYVTVPGPARGVDVADNPAPAHGPLSRVLDTLATAAGSGQHVAARRLVAERSPHEPPQSGSTWRGHGEGPPAELPVAPPASRRDAAPFALRASEQKVLPRSSRLAIWLVAGVLVLGGIAVATSIVLRGRASATLPAFDAPSPSLSTSSSKAAAVVVVPAAPAETPATSAPTMPAEPVTSAASAPVPSAKPAVRPIATLPATARPVPAPAESGRSDFIRGI